MTDQERVYSLMKEFCTLERGNPRRPAILLEVKQIIDFPTKAKADGFEDFWKAYPHKVAKGAAEKAWPKARKEAALEVILSGVEWYRRNKPDDCPYAHPASWLNAKRWLDGQYTPTVKETVTYATDWETRMAKEIGDTQFKHWFTGSYCNGEVLITPDALKRHWITQRYGQSLKMLGIKEII